MRKVELTDLHHAACLLQDQSASNRVSFCGDLLIRAHAADKFVKRLKKLHPKWGDGSLRAAAVVHESRGVQRGTTSDFLACLAIVLSVLADRNKDPMRQCLSERVCIAANNS